MYPFTDCCPNLPGADPGCDDGWCCTHETWHGEPEDDHPAAASPCANGVYAHGPHTWLEPVNHECPGWPVKP